MTGFLVAAAAALSAWSVSGAIDFHGKTRSMISGSEPGGGTDRTGRLLAGYFEEWLPGNLTTLEEPLRKNGVNVK